MKFLECNDKERAQQHDSYVTLENKTPAISVENLDQTVLFGRLNKRKTGGVKFFFSLLKSTYNICTSKNTDEQTINYRGKYTRTVTTLDK